MRRRGFLKGLAAAVALAAVDVFGKEEEPFNPEGLPYVAADTFSFTCHEEVGVTIANMNSVIKVTYIE